MAPGLRSSETKICPGAEGTGGTQPALEPDNHVLMPVLPTEPQSLLSCGGPGTPMEGTGLTGKQFLHFTHPRQRGDQTLPPYGLTPRAALTWCPWSV